MTVITGWVEHAMDIFKKVFQGNQVKLSVQIDSVIFPPALTVLTFTQGHNGAKGDMVSVIIILPRVKHSFS